MGPRAPQPAGDGALANIRTHRCDFNRFAVDFSACRFLLQNFHKLSGEFGPFRLHVLSLRTTSAEAQMGRKSDKKPGE